MINEKLKNRVKRFNEELEKERKRLFDKYFPDEVEYDIWKEQHPDGIYKGGTTYIGFANEHGTPTIQCRVYVYEKGKQYPYELTISNLTSLVNIREED